MAVATPNDCLTLLKTTMEAVIVPAYATEVFPYRILTDRVKTMVSLTYLGGLPFGGVVDSNGQEDYYDFAAVLMTTHEGTEATIQAAEETLNSVEYQIFTTLKPTKTAYWHKVIFDRPSVRPGAPQDFPMTRYGLIYFRLLAK
jgi:hypothetical protein